VCDGSSSVCPNGCSTDAECASGDYCDATGKCQPQKTQGAACNTAAGNDCKVSGCRECATGNCVDGLCCDTACTTACMACAAALKQSGAQDGTCGPAKAQTNPHNDNCTADGAASCKHDGKCDGMGACGAVYPAGTSCGGSTCNNGSASGLLCDGMGTCATTSVNCAPYACANGGCAMSCASDNDCASTAYCNTANKTCTPRQAQGGACTADDQCPSADLCVDGVCCNAICNGECEACDVAGHAGTCLPVTGAPHGSRNACTGVGTTCGGTCDGTNRAACTYPGATTVCGQSCMNAMETASSCDGKGTCVVVMPVECPGSFACADATTCKTACVTDADCIQGFACGMDGKCSPKSGKCGPDGHSVVDTGGTVKACDPFACSGGACRMTCGTISDCAPPNVCDTNGQCVAPPTSQDSGSSGGCAIAFGESHESHDRASLFVLGFVAVVVGAARRRRARR
jgi:hypothetical protein